MSGGVIACVKEAGFQRREKLTGRNRKSLACVEAPTLQIIS